MSGECDKCGECGFECLCGKPDANGWISVKKMPPKKLKEVLTFEIIKHIKNGKRIPIILIEEVKSLHKDANGVYSDGGGENITHWMPLPAPPETKD